MSKKGALNKVGKMEAQDSFGDGMGDRPWWLPEDLDGKSEQMARDMVASLPEKMQLQIQHTDKARMSKKQKQELWQTLTLTAMESPEWRVQFAKAGLMKPLEMAKIMNANVPKAQEIVGEVHHRHAIVVPATLDNDAWNEGQKVNGQALTEGWEAESPWGNVQDAEVMEEP